MKSTGLCLSVAAMIAGCYPANMALHKDAWPAKEEYKVTSKRGLFTKERIEFGEFRTVNVQRSWVKEITSHFGLAKRTTTGYHYTILISLEYLRRRQAVAFSLADAALQRSEVYCFSKFNTEEIIIGNRRNSVLNIGVDIVKTTFSQPDSKYHVQIYTKEGEQLWVLALDNVQSQLKPKSYVGYLSQGKEQLYTIVPVREVESKNDEARSILFGAIGLEIRNKQGKAVSAVSMLNKGMIYLQTNDAEENFLLANACAALFMQDEIG